jgi:endogenous inhibitor of DNA gyrase (YacG/DUF329 family)
MTDEQAAAYIAGFIDGEGHIGCHKNATGHWSRSIGFCNTDKVAASKPCEVCGKPVRVSPAQRKRGDGRFCSVECRGIKQRNRVEKSCETCGKPFVVIATRRNTARFCSASCFGKSQADRVRGMARMAANTRWGIGT